MKILLIAVLMDDVSLPDSIESVYRGWARENDIDLSIRCTCSVAGVRTIAEVHGRYSDGICISLDEVQIDTPIFCLGSVIHLPIVLVHIGAISNERIHQYSNFCQSLKVSKFIYGRKQKGLRWAFRFLANYIKYPFKTVRYGSSEKQVMDLRVPDSGTCVPLAVVCILHGGFWRSAFERDLTDELAGLITKNLHVATLNIEYRCEIDGNNSPKAPLDDISQAIDRINSIDENYHLDKSNLFLLGHSAGATLAMNYIERALDVMEREGIVIRGVCSLAGVTNLNKAKHMMLGAGAVDEFFSENECDQYCPAQNYSKNVPVLVIHGKKDDTVPLSFSVDFHSELLSRGLNSNLEIISEASHMDITRNSFSGIGKMYHALERFFATNRNSINSVSIV